MATAVATVAAVKSAKSRWWRGPVRLLPRCRPTPTADREKLDLEPLDPGAVRLEDGEPQLFAPHLVTRLGRATELAEHEAGNGVEVLLLELGCRTAR